jgi:hypothetical protein
MWKTFYERESWTSYVHIVWVDHFSPRFPVDALVADKKIDRSMRIWETTSLKPMKNSSMLVPMQKMRIEQSCCKE